MTKLNRDLLKLACRVQTVSRSEAVRLSRSRGLPYLHAGNERYINLTDAIAELGVDDAVHLAEDRRSLLHWPTSCFVVTMLFQVITVTDRSMLSPSEAEWFSRCTPFLMETPPLPAAAGETACLLASLHQDLTAMKHESQVGPLPLDAHRLRRLLHGLTLALAMMNAMHPGNAAAMTPGALRDQMAAMITALMNPDFTPIEINDTGHIVVMLPRLAA